jgi:hypothetical protein
MALPCGLLDSQALKPLHFLSWAEGYLRWAFVGFTNSLALNFFCRKLKLTHHTKYVPITFHDDLKSMYVVTVPPFDVMFSLRKLHLLGPCLCPLLCICASLCPVADIRTPVSFPVLMQSQRNSYDRRLHAVLWFFIVNVGLMEDDGHPLRFYDIQNDNCGMPFSFCSWWSSVSHIPEHGKSLESDQDFLSLPIPIYVYYIGFLLRRLVANHFCSTLYPFLLVLLYN